MISALAARKANGNRNSDPKPVSPAPISKSSVPSSAFPTPNPSEAPKSSRPAKRKNAPVNNTANLSRFRKKNRNSLSSNRYFEEPLPSSAASDTSVASGSRSPSPELVSLPSPPESSDEGIDSDLEDLPQRSIPVPQQRSDFFSPVSKSRIVHIQHEQCSFIIHPGEELFLLGTYQFYVVYGCVSFYGSTISSETTEWRDVYAPNFCAIPSFKPINNASVVGTIPTYASSNSLPSGSAIVEIRPFKPFRFQFLDGIIPIFKDTFMASHCEKILDGIYLVPPTTNLPLLMTNSSWGPVLQEPAKPNIHLVRGPRNCGKSTFARVLLNNLLDSYDSVAYLDTDLGQSEFTPSGFVGLYVIKKEVYGPPFTHQTIPVHPNEGVTHYLGISSPKPSPSMYLNAIRACVETYFESVRYPVSASSFSSRRRRRAGHSEPESSVSASDKKSDIVPLIINTQGWTKGLGSDLQRTIDDALLPFLPTPTGGFPSVANDLSGQKTGGIPKSDDVVVYDLTPTRSSFPSPLGSSVVPEIQGESFNVIKIEPHSPPPGLKERYSAADLRNLMLLSYFYSSSPSPHLLLSAQAPYVIAPSQTISQVILTGSGSEDVVPEEVGRVLIGALVGFVECQSEVFRDTLEQTSLQHLYQSGTSPPEPRESRCIGLGFIRSVAPSLADSSNVGQDDGSIHVITPIPSELLANGNRKILVKGQNEMCIWGWLPPIDSTITKEDGEKDVPFLQFFKAEGLGADKRRVRRGLMRKGQM